MSSDVRKRLRPLTLVDRRDACALDAADTECEGAPSNARPRDLDWSILMAHAQAGDRAAYRRLLEEIAPYVRSIAARSHRDRCDVEDTLQDVLLTVHAVRHTYDPTRPFGPWLVAIVNRRIVDRLRRLGRVSARETTLTDEDHETFAAPEANLDEATSAAQIVREAVGCLPHGQRRAVELLKLKELSLKEAAAVTGMSVAALKVASHRGIRRLRELLATANTRDHDT